jgi:hypothetical protein
MTTLVWPCEVLRAQNISFDIAPRTLAGPASVSGFTQVVASDAGIWKASFGNVDVRGRDKVLMFRTLATRLEGRLVPILVPRCGAYQPVAPGADSSLRDQVPHSDDAFFSDNTGYVGAGNSVRLVADMPARAVSITVDIEYGGSIHEGMDFSIGERMYRVHTYDFTSGVIWFRPPAREAAPAGTALEFDDPVCRMRLASDLEMDLELALHRFGAPSVTFLEDV